MEATLSIDDIKARVDPVDLIGRDTRLFRVSHTDGGEWAGPCPWCGGRDRLHVKAKSGLWRCRQCGDPDHWEDAVSYVMRRDSTGFREAIDWLRDLVSGHPEWQHRDVDSVPPPYPVAPDREWQESALAIVDRCAQTLWSPSGRGPLEYLHGRGLTEDTIRTWSLGCTLTDGEIEGFWVPQGITIPWAISGTLWHVKIRRTAEQARYRYTSIKGGTPVLYAADTLAVSACAVLCEGELDTLLLWQEVGWLVGTASLGSASAQLNLVAAEAIRHCEKVLLAYDADEAGDRGAYALGRRYPLMRPIRVPSGKDVGEFFVSGGDIQGWLTPYLPNDIQRKLVRGDR